MLPVSVSFSTRRCTIWSEVKPSAMVKACCTTLPSMMVSTTSRRLAFLVKRYSPYFNSFCALSTSAPAMNSVG